MPQGAKSKRKGKKKGPRIGNELIQRLEQMRTVSSDKLVLGQRVWVKVQAYCDWPGIIWSIELCLKKIVPELVNSYSPGTVLVRFYGDQSSMYCKKCNVKPLEENYDRRYNALKQWGCRRHDKKREQKATWAIEDLDMSLPDYKSELDRMLQLQESVLCAHNPDSILCPLCKEGGAQLKCRACERYLHPLCLTPPALTPEDIPPNETWLCPSCGEENQVIRDPMDVEEAKVERLGLTPDWIIHAGAFKVFQLKEPTPAAPYIRGLLDPCTNSKIAPNIPAEILFDKNDDGLKLSNKWTGHHIILNPDFKAHVRFPASKYMGTKCAVQIQWRFVNRAIDEVENDSVPGVLLICRNSTDTAYFQRLMPYPRVLLRRNSIRFKDYDKTPIGFGIVVFCIVKRHFHSVTRRFMESFAPFGEPNVVIDKTWLLSPSFESLLKRLCQYANQHHRDHWVQCCKCEKWRIVSYEALLNAKRNDWECKDLNPPFSNCNTARSKAEIQGVRYAVMSEDGLFPEDLDDKETKIAAASLPSVFPPTALAKDEQSLPKCQACSLAAIPFNKEFSSCDSEHLSEMANMIMQQSPMMLEGRGLVIRPLVVDNTTYATIVKMLRSVAMQSQVKTTPSPSKRAAPMASGSSKKLKPSVEAPEVIEEQIDQVKSGLELSRELNRRIHARWMEIDCHEQAAAQRLDAEAEEAEKILEVARNQVVQKTKEEERVSREREELETRLEKRKLEFDEEYLQVERKVKVLKAEIDKIKGGH